MSAPRIGIVHGPGAAGPMEVVRGCAGLAEPVFLVPHAEVTDELTGTLDLLGGELHPVTAPDPDPAELTALGLAGVTTFSERRVPLTAAIARVLGLPGQPPDAVVALTDKAAQRAALRAAGLPVPQVTAVDRLDQVPDALAQHRLPVVLKPRRGEGSLSTVLLRDAADAQPAALAAAGVHDVDGAAGWLLEEYLVGRDCAPFGDFVSVESVIQAGVVLRCSVTSKFPLVPPFREAGQLAPGPLGAAERTELAGAATAALAAVGIRHGITHTELKRTERGPVVIEVNGRLGGGNVRWVTRHAAGFDLLRDAISVALGQPPEPVQAPEPGIAVSYLTLAPEWPARLVAVRGVREARAVPGVTGFQPLVRPGDLVGTGTGSEFMTLATCVVPGVEDLWPTLGAVTDAVSFDVTPADAAETRTVSARDLPSARILPAVAVGKGPGDD